MRNHLQLKPAGIPIVPQPGDRPLPGHLQKDENSNFNLGVFGCQGGGSSAQVFSLTKSNQFRREINCLNVEWPNRRDPKSAVATLKECSKNSQTWKLGEVGVRKFVCIYFLE
uniref:Ricin B lectin domain-containing protein n=1 Tax=Ditylenchus dipsaci TaxID=166011 RepID=A0A915DFP9_9BILA